MGLNRVLEPLNIRGITLANRIVFPAFQTNFAAPDGIVTERLLSMYRKIAAGTYASMAHMAPPPDMGEGVHVHLAKDIRDAVDIPVIYTGNIWSLEYADRIIMENKSDLVAICRSQLADPRFIKKSLSNQPVNKFTGCGTCIYFLRGANSVSCPQNPEL